MQASIGGLYFVKPEFECVYDIPNGGVLLALPALINNGLLKFDEYFSLPKGYYSLTTFFLFISFMSLARCKTSEELRYDSPGEWGKLLGLDRAPEVRTVRNKLHLLANQEVAKWCDDLSLFWLNKNNENKTLFYIDGHVRIYYGDQTKLPYHYVTKKKQCSRATADYWVNASDGQPYFLVNKAVDPGLIKVMNNDLVPELEKMLPDTLTQQEISNYSHRFTLIFDREGYSPDFFLAMKEKHIACQTYHKYQGEEWLITEFSDYILSFPNGENEEIILAERGIFLANKIWVREIRKLCKNGKQTAIISTDFKSEITTIALNMFTRWIQENYFKYMSIQYGIDKLVSNHLEELPAHIEVINPEFRVLDKSTKAMGRQFKKKNADLSIIQRNEKIEQDIKELKIKELELEINDIDNKMCSLKRQKKETDKYIKASELTEADQFNQLDTTVKKLTDTVKMIAYRAETEIAKFIKKHIARQDDTRHLLQALFQTEADLIPNHKNNTLTVKIHPLASNNINDIIDKLCQHLNQSAVIYPDTNYQINYELVR
jgi:hypothetical protein